MLLSLPRPPWQSPSGTGAVRTIELGGFGVLLDTLNTGPSRLLRGNNARSSFQCQDFIHDDMFQVLITPLKSISRVEVNQALFAWSFRQPTELFLAHPAGQSEISCLNSLSTFVNKKLGFRSIFGNIKIS